MTRRNGPLLFILATLMIDAIGIGIVFPIMPDLMARSARATWRRARSGRVS
jgi:DHA1 family tetracycline resistance protein-like MFS transporter